MSSACAAPEHQKSKTMDELSKMRQEYESDTLDERQMAADPLETFTEWMYDVIAFGLKEPNAMTVATATPEGKPSARVVLLKEVQRDGFVFFTNYLSRKGRELITNPFAAVVFDWHDMARQVRVEGRVEKLSPEASDAYFEERPGNAKIGAWSSPQSKIVKDRAEIEQLQMEMTLRFAGTKVKRPTHWGGFLIRPEVIEFWQGRPDRLHDRIVYYKTEEGWSKHRLAP